MSAFFVVVILLSLQSISDHCDGQTHGELDGDLFETEACSNDCECEGVLICQNGFCDAPQPYVCQRLHPHEWQTGAHQGGTCAEYDASYKGGVYHDTFCTGFFATKAVLEDLYVWEVCPECNRCTLQPTMNPTYFPSTTPTTSHPSTFPTFFPSSSPSISSPTVVPTTSTPSQCPTRYPSSNPTTEEPTLCPTTDSPSCIPSTAPSNFPTTDAPTFMPSQSPSISNPTIPPTDLPTPNPSPFPTTEEPTLLPTTEEPTVSPTTDEPTKSPTYLPSFSPLSSNPSYLPSKHPSVSPPTGTPSLSSPTRTPSVSPTSSKPTNVPTTTEPSYYPSETPSVSLPTRSPSISPITSIPTNLPTNSEPSFCPSASNPSKSPTPEPTIYLVDVTFVAEYDRIVEDKSTFLSNCSAAVAPVVCYDVVPGSVILSLTGDVKAVEAAVSEMHASGLSIPGYATMFTDELTDAPREESFGASAGGTTISAVIVVVIVIFILGVAVFAMWPYRDKILSTLGIVPVEDDDEESKKKALAKKEYRHAQKIEIYEVQPQETTVLQAIEMNDLKAMSLALESNCDINERDTEDHSTAAILTVQKRQDPDVLRFLAENDADLNAKNAQGNAPCHLAAKEGLDMHLQLLIDHQADLQARNSEGLTPLEIARQNRRGDIVQMLQDHFVEIACEEDYSSDSKPSNLEKDTSSDPLAFVSLSKKGKPLPKVKRTLPPFSRPIRSFERIKRKELFA